MLLTSTLGAQTEEQTADEYQLKGMDALKMNHNIRAIQFFEKAIELDPVYDQPLFNKGVAHMNLENYEEALLDFERLTELSKDVELLKWSYNNLAWIHQRITKDLPAALKSAQMVLAIDSTYCPGHNMLGGIFFENKKYVEALRSYNSAINFCSNNAEYYYNRGVAFSKLSLYHEAISDFSKAISLDATYLDAYFCRGIAKGNLNLPQEEMKDYSKAISLDSTYYKAYLNRGIVRDQIGDFEGAMKDHNKSIEINDSNPYAYNNRGYTKYKMRDFENAKIDCEKSIQLNQDNSYAYHYLGLIEYELGNTEKACILFKKAVSMGKEDAKKDILEKCAKQ